MRKFVLTITLISLNHAVLFPTLATAQSYAGWYAGAQQRIDTLRKGDFGIRIIDKEGQPYTGEVAVRLKKHAFPFGIAFDFYEGISAMGKTYSTSEAVSAHADHEIYQTERWDKYLAYAIPVQAGMTYTVTLKLAEIYHSSANSRIFDARVDGTLFLDNYDIFAEAGGKNKAIDTSLQVTADKSFIGIEFTATVDNAAIKGIIVDEAGGGNVIRINCGGPAMTTESGNLYVNEEGYFDPDISTVATKEQWMKAAMYKYFNYGASGNSFKWSGIQPFHTEPDYTDFDNAVRWTRKVGWELRAHTLLWGGNDDHSMPRWVRELPTARAITDTCKMRVTREVSRYRGIIREYDVINEPLTGHADSLRNNVGDSILWNCFKWARSADPDAELYINDYNVEYNWGQAEEYRDLIIQIREMGGPVTGVGVQAHFWDCCRPNVDELVRNLNIIAEAGLPIRLTEYDYGGNLTQAQQAADFIKVLTVAFSHPSVNGMICWGLSDDGAWRANTGFFDAEHKPKLAADTLLYYTKTRWVTNFDTVLLDPDTLSFNAYYGEYEIEANFGDTVKVFSVPCLEAYSDSVFSLYEEDGVLKGPRLVRAERNEGDTVTLIFDKAVLNNSVKRGDFRIFTNNEIAIEEILTDPDRPAVLSMILDNPVEEEDYISVSYFPGYLSGTDGSKAGPFGPEAVVFQAKDTVIDPVWVPSPEPGRLVTVYPNPASDHLTIRSSDAPFEFGLFDIRGTAICSGRSESSSFYLDVSSCQNGVYILRITIPGAATASHLIKVIR